MYFSGVPRGDWPRGVDARPSARPKEDAVSASSESGGTNAGRTKRSPPVSKKVRGKTVVVDELAQKKRKTTGVAPLKPSVISLGGDRTTQTWSAMVSEWSDDDEVPVAPPPSTKAPPCSARVEEQSVRGEEVPQQWEMEVPEQQSRGAPEQQAKEVPKQ